MLGNIKEVCRRLKKKMLGIKEDLEVEKNIKKH